MILPGHLSISRPLGFFALFWALCTPSGSQASLVAIPQSSSNMPSPVKSLSVENTTLACKAAQKALGLDLVDTVPLNQTEVEVNW